MDEEDFEKELEEWAHSAAAALTKLNWIIERRKAYRQNKEKLDSLREVTTLAEQE